MSLSAPRQHEAPLSVATALARRFARLGIRRVFGLCGGHIMPLWMALDAEGIAIVDVRDERAAVHMAQGHAEVTGELGVALVTAGPGVANAVTGIANAHVSRAPVLVLSGCPPRPQRGRGALQDMDHPALVRSITRYARTAEAPDLAPAALDEAVARALGQGGEPGPVLVDFPTDVLRAGISPVLAAPGPMPGRADILPDPDAVERAVSLLMAARRPLVVTGRGARGAGPQLGTFLDRFDALHIDTGESRGLLPDDHSATANTMRAAAMAEADLVVTIGRRLDFQLAYGSPAVFRNASFLRIAETASELRDNRRGEIELFATPARALEAILDGAGNRAPERDGNWLERMREGHRTRVGKLRATSAAAEGADGRIHPMRLVSAIQNALPENAIVAVDGGDFLSFARIGLSAPTVLDPGPLGCIGVGLPYGIAASLACPDRPVVVATGDGAFGFNAVELDTAVRHEAPVLVVVANNGAWQIEVHDQAENHGRVVGTKLRFSDYAAMARGFGMHGERVERAEDLEAAMERAMANRPALLDVVVSPDAVSPDGRSGLARVPDLQAVDAWDEAERIWRAEGKGRT